LLAFLLILSYAFLILINFEVNWNNRFKIESSELLGDAVPSLVLFFPSYLWSRLVLVVLPDPLWRIGAQRNSTETQQSGRTPRSYQSPKWKK